MRSLIYLFAILTGLTAPHNADAQISAPVAVDAAQALYAAEQQEQLAPAALYFARQHHFALAIVANITLIADTPSRLFHAPVHRADHARE
jgi:hypothetical protein